MRTRTSVWFETKIAYEKTMEDGMQRKVKELYTVDALSFTEAEKRITEEMASYISGEFEVDAITRASYKEIFFSDSESADRWYKVKVQFITIDEKTEKEKRMNVFYLVQAANIDDAKKNTDTAMSGTMIGYEVVSVVETKIMDVYEYTHAAPSSEPEDDSEDDEPEMTEQDAKRILSNLCPEGCKMSVKAGGKEMVIADKTKEGHYETDQG